MGNIVYTRIFRYGNFWNEYGSYDEIDAVASRLCDQYLEAYKKLFHEEFPRLSDCDIVDKNFLHNTLVMKFDNDFEDMYISIAKPYYFRESLRLYGKSIDDGYPGEYNDYDRYTDYYSIAEDLYGDVFKRIKSNVDRYGIERLPRNIREKYYKYAKGLKKEAKDLYKLRHKADGTYKTKPTRTSHFMEIVASHLKMLYWYNNEVLDIIGDSEINMSDLPEMDKKKLHLYFARMGLDALKTMRWENYSYEEYEKLYDGLGNFLENMKENGEADSVVECYYYLSWDRRDMENPRIETITFNDIYEQYKDLKKMEKPKTYQKTYTRLLPID